MVDSSIFEQQSLIEDAARRFLQDNYVFADHRKMVAEQPGYSRSQWREMAKLGWMLLPIRAEFDGLGGDMALIAALAKEFGRSLYISPFLPSAVVSSQLIQDSSNESIRDSMLNGIGSGEFIISPALYEPQSRYSLENIKCTAHRYSDKIVLNGKKSAVLYANAADSFVVLARLNGSNDSHDDLLCLVPSNHDGVKLTHYRTHDGASMSALTLSNVSLQENRVLLCTSAVYQSVERAIGFANASICAELVGAMEAIMEITLEYVKTRAQFGKKLSSFQSLQHRLVDMFIRCQLAESMSREALRATQLRDRTEREMIICAAKCEIARAALLNAEEAVQLHGAMGMMEEMPVGHYLKRIFTLSLLFGDADYHQARYRDLRLQASRLN